MSKITTRYIAFLRGMNVGGHRVTMSALRTHFESLGLTNVETFIASGNVIFDARGRVAADALERAIEVELRDALGYRVATFLRTLPELHATIAASPFDPVTLAESAHSLHVGFLREPPDPAITAQLVTCNTAMDELAVVGRTLYWLCRGKISSTLIKWPALERTTRLEVTMRNITTVKKLAAKYGGG